MKTRHLLLITAIISSLSGMTLGCSSQKLLIESEPSGGTVFINDKMVGKTPVTVSYVDLPYDDSLSLRIEKQDFSAVTAFVQGPKQAGLGEKVHVKLSKAPDETAALNVELDRMMQAHKMALSHRYVEAQRIVDQMVDEHPQLIAPRLLKGAILLMAKNYDLARDQYKEVLSQDPSNEEAIKMLNYLDTRGSSPAREVREPAARESSGSR